jgi:hypothetical protein
MTVRLVEQAQPTAGAGDEARGREAARWGNGDSGYGQSFAQKPGAHPVAVPGPGQLPPLIANSSALAHCVLLDSAADCQGAAGLVPCGAAAGDGR